MYHILLTNDDGAHAPPFKALWFKVLEKELGETFAVVPEHEMSAAGKGITLHKPLRIRRIPVKLGRLGYRLAYTVSGTPGDAVTVAVKYIMDSKPDLVMSGINVGDHITLDNIFTSGTIAAALQGYLLGFTSVAFSVEIPTGVDPRPMEKFLRHAELAAEIGSWILDRGLPPGVDLLNVNFPFKLSDDTPVRITRLAKIKFENYVLERSDPRGKPYYWLGGNPVPVTENMRGTDLYALMVERAVSITPLRLDMSLHSLNCEEFNETVNKAMDQLGSLVERLRETLKNMS